jgi:hypothetical protein
MAIVGGGLLGHLKQGGFGLFGKRGKTGQIVLRARSRRAYSFEIYPREAVSDLCEVGAVYGYARAVPANAATDASGAGLAIGYVGRTDDMGRRDAEHEARGDFIGHGFDIVLILRIAQAPIRTDIERDLIDTFNPVLNDLLRGIERGETS